MTASIRNGKNIIKSAKSLKANIYDVTPTILSLFGLPIPNELDGKVLNLIKKTPIYGDIEIYKKKILKNK